MHSGARSFIPAGILLAGCGLLFYARNQVGMPLARPLETVLANVPGYRVADQRLSDEEQKVAGMTSYVARAYLRDSTVAFATLVSYYDRQTHGKTIHSPRNCLPGAGWEVVERGSQNLTVDGVAHEVNRFILRNGRAAALAYYWYQGRGRVTANEYAVKWNLLRDAAMLGHTEEALVRLIIPLSATSTLTTGTASDASLPEETLGRNIATRLMAEVESVLPTAGGSRLAAVSR